MYIVLEKIVYSFVIFYELINLYFNNLQVTGYNKLAGSSFEVTSNYILPSNHGTQGSYIDLPVGQEAVKFDFDLVSTSSSYVALSEIEIFSDPSPDELR
jgi:hypothetical protein